MIVLSFVSALAYLYSYVQDNTGTRLIQEVRSATYPQPHPEPIKLMTYNIHYGVGTDDIYNLQTVIDTIKAQEADIIALNEVDHMMPRTAFQKQDEILKNAFGYEAVYAPNINLGAKYGNMLISKYPILSWTNHRLPRKGRFSEPRGLIEAQIDIDGQTLNVFVTHLSTNRQERKKQMDFIRSYIKTIKAPTVLMGDFNELPDSSKMEKITDILKDTATEAYATFPADVPNARIDYVFVSSEITIKDNQVIESQASDHLPVIAKIYLE